MKEQEKADGNSPIHHFRDKYGSDDDEDREDIKEYNKQLFRNTYDDEYDDSMDQYVRFGVDGGETEDERASLTASVEIEQEDESTLPCEEGKKPRRNKIEDAPNRKSLYTGRPTRGKQRRK